MSIVDLAGSERLSRTRSEGMRLEEAKVINKSISALGNCISALSSGKPSGFIPFRDSKLTRLLTDSLSGNSKTTLIACVSSSVIQFEESYSTLLFGNRAMYINTYATLNEQILVKPQNKNKDSPGDQHFDQVMVRNAMLGNIYIYIYIIYYIYIYIENQKKVLTKEVYKLRGELSWKGGRSRGEMQRSNSTQGNHFSRGGRSNRSLTPPRQPFQAEQITRISTTPELNPGIIPYLPRNSTPNNNNIFNPPLNNINGSFLNTSQMTEETENDERSNKLIKKLTNAISHLQNEIARKVLYIYINRI